MKKKKNSRQVTITETTTTAEGNALIMRKGRTSLLSAKVMLFALLKVEERGDQEYTIQELQYYNQLKRDTSVDYTKGLVAEIDVSELKKVLKKSNSGSFYSSLKELFSIDPHEEKSLRNSWAVMLQNNDSGVLGYAEIITACHYDTNSGKLFIKFSEEECIRSQLWQIKSEYTELPLLLMLSFKSIYTYRLYEIIYSEMTKTDNSLKESGEYEVPIEYSFRFPLGELQFMLGVIDVTCDKEGKRRLGYTNPDYNSIALDVNTRQRENMGEYRSFKRYSLNVATAEINATEAAAFTISYDIEKEENGKRVAYIIFYVQRKTMTEKPQPSILDNEKEKQPNRSDFIVELARQLSSLSLSFDELNQISEIANFDMGIVISAYNLYQQLNITDDFVVWFADLRT